MTTFAPISSLIHNLYTEKGLPLVLVMPPAVAFPTQVIADLPDDVPMTILTMHMPEAYKPRPNIKWVSAFFAHAEREMAEWDNVSAYDVNFSDIWWHYLASGPDLIITQATAVLADGTRSLGPNADYTLDLIENGIPVYVIENSNMPRVKGNHFTGNVIGVEQSSQPLYTVKGRMPTDADRAMADHIAPLIPAGSTCQLGVGGLARSIVERVSIGAVWTEAIGDWVMDLPAWTPITGTIAFGSAELYRWMDNNPAVTMRPARVTNGYAEMRQHRVYSVNQAMMIDLDGGTSLRPGYSGLGGGAETTRNAYRSFVAAPEVRKGKCNLGHAGYTLHHPSQTAEYLVTTQGIVQTRPHWTAGEFFDGTAASLRELITHRLAAPEHRRGLSIRNGGAFLAAA